jgi:hypothetical protein
MLMLRSLRFIDHLEILLRIFSEFRLTVVAALFDFLTFIDEDMWLPHGTKLLTRNHTMV